MICSICGRKLSNPKSIELGYGPVCYGKVSGGPKIKKKAKAAISRPQAECPCYDIPGQMNLEDYLMDS
ncbi:MAG: hypothetical protein K2N87_18440 [Eubacterium sp.]|nr:hypothetical protein [Eubacterium sp.]